MAKDKLYLIDDDPSCLEATGRMLKLCGYEVFEYDSAKCFLEDIDGDAAGCVIADLRMPEINGLGLQQQLKKINEALPVIFLTAHGNIPTTVEAMREGAEDFITKDAPRESLLSAIERALDRYRQAQFKASELGSLRKRLATLTPREREVLELVVSGCLNKQIADKLGITERTVKFHRSSGFRKMGVSSVAKLTSSWLRVQGN